MTIEHDAVVLTQDMPDEGLTAGDAGTVVRVHPNNAGYEVEFMTLNGQTIAVVTHGRASPRCYTSGHRSRPGSGGGMRQNNPLVRRLGDRLSFLLATLLSLFLPSESSALIHRDLSPDADFLAAETCRNVPVNRAVTNTGSYAYDPFTRRIGMTLVRGGVTNVYRFVYDGPDVVAEFVDVDGDGVADRKRVYWLTEEIDQRIGFADITAGGVKFYYYLVDQVGTVQQIVDESGAVVNQYEYDAWGNVHWNSSNTIERVENRYLFHGREWDPIGLHYSFRFRSMLPDQHIFDGSDRNLAAGIYRETEGFGSAAFCRNVPVDTVDPYGKRYRPVEKRDAEGRLIGVEMEYYAPTGDEGTGYSLDAFDFIAGTKEGGLWDAFDAQFQHVVSRSTKQYPFGDLSEMELQEAVNRGYVNKWDWPLIATRDQYGDWLVGKKGSEAITEVAITAGAAVFFGAVFGEFAPSVSQTPRSVTHLTNPRAAQQILQSQRVGGRWGIFALDADKIPASQAGRMLKTMVPGNLSAEVEITGPAVQAFNRPPMFGPVSMLRRFTGVLSTPLGSINLQTGQFVPNEILVNGVFRQATQSEIVLSRMHQFLLDYGYDTLIYGGAGAYWYLTKDPETTP